MKVPTLIFGMQADVYHRDFCPEPSLTQSTAHTLVTRSPMHAWLQHPRYGASRRATTKELDRGTLVHCILLNAGRDIVHVTADDWRTKAAREARDNARAEGKLAVLQRELDRAQEAARHIEHQLVDFGLRLDGQSEVAAVWKEPADDGTEVWCRAMLDHWLESRAVVIDLKTTADAHPLACARSMVSFGYDIQAHAYTRAVEAALPQLAGRVRFIDVFCEVEPPYMVTPVIPAGSMRELGERRWRRAVNAWAECQRNDRWPGYTEDVVSIEAPQWALNQELDANVTDL